MEKVGLIEKVFEQNLEVNKRADHADVCRKVFMAEEIVDANVLRQEVLKARTTVWGSGQSRGRERESSRK